MYFKRILSILVFSALPTLAFAGEGDFSAGLKVGMIDPDCCDSESALGVQLGYRATSRIAAEVELLQADFGSVDFDSFAVYGTYRSPGDMYFLGKIGIASLDGAGDNETGLSFGLGGGISLGNNLAVEVEYTVLDSDVNFFGLTGKLTFN